MEGEHKFQLRDDGGLDESSGNGFVRNSQIVYILKVEAIELADG